MKNFAKKWIIQRITATILIPLTFWFVYNCLSFVSMNFDQLLLFFNSPINSFLFLIMMITMLIHGKLGCETVVNDYVKSKNLRYLYFLTINFFAYLSILVVIFSISKILFND